MKTPQFARDLRDYALAGKVPSWANEQYCYFCLHTSEPKNANDAWPQYNGYAPAKMLRSEWKDVDGKSVLSRNVEFPKFVSKESAQIKITHTSIRIGNTLAYVQELSAPVVLLSGYIPVFDKDETSIIES